MAIPIKFVQFIFHFVILTLNCARWVPCSTGLATLASAKQVHADPHATVFYQGQNSHTPSPRYAAIYSKPDASSYWPFEWSIPGPVQYVETRNNFFGPAELVSCVPMHAQRLLTLNFDILKNVKAILKQN